MRNLEEKQARLIPGARVYDRGDGSWVVIDADCCRYAVLDREEADIVELFDGRKLREIAYHYSITKGRIPFRSLQRVYGKLLLAGLIAEEPADQKKPWMTFLKSIAVAGRKIVKCGENPARVEPLQKDYRVLDLYTIILLSFGIGLLAWLGLPYTRQLLVPSGSSTLGLLTIYLAICLGLSLRAFAIRSALRQAGMPKGVSSLKSSYGLLYWDPGAERVVLAPMKLRLSAYVLAIAFLVLAAGVARGMAHISAGKGIPTSIWNISATTWLGLAFLEACPLGKTGAYDIFSSVSPRGRPLSSAVDYLRRRYFVAFGKDNSVRGELALVVFSIWMLVWLLVAFHFISKLAEGNLVPLARILSGKNMFDLVIASIFILWMVLMIVLGLLAPVAVLFLSLSSIFSKLRPAAILRPVEMETERIASALGRFPLFSSLASDAIARIASASKVISFKQRDIIIRQGDYGEHFFLMMEGQAEVLVEDPLGKVERVARLGPGDGFGEVALIESVPRTATVRALSFGKAIAIDRISFQTATQGREGSDLIYFIRGSNVIKSSSIFADLDPQSISRLLHRMNKIDMAKGQVIIRRGEVGDFFYLILEGEVEVLGPDDKTPVAVLHPGDHFGEIALIANVPRTATVVARADGKLLSLSRDDFNQFFSEHLWQGERLEKLGAERLAELRSR